MDQSESLNHSEQETTLSESPKPSNTVLDQVGTKRRVDPEMLTVQQIMFFTYYLDVGSETFDDVVASGVKAGYTHSTATQIARQRWFKAGMKVTKKILLQKAERNLHELLDLKCDIIAKDKDGNEIWDHDGSLKRILNAPLLRIKADITKFVAERVGKEDYAEGHILVRIDV